MTEASDTTGSSVSSRERLRRWRLVLGAPADITPDVVTPDDAAASGPSEAPGDGPDGRVGGPAARARGRSSGGVPQPLLDGDDVRIDAALGALYDAAAAGGSRRGGSRSPGSRRGGLGRSQPAVARWLGDIRRYFPTPVVQMLQRDAVERLDLRQLLLEPELLAATEPDVRLVAMLVELNRVLPDQTRATARIVIAQVLEQLRRELGDDTRQAVRGALARHARSHRPLPADIDWQRTIAANLRHWLPEQRTVVPERLVGHGRRRPSLARDVIVAVDQSGSMAESVVFASLFAGVLAQLPALRTRFVAFDTAVTDLSDHLHDPVDLLFGVQLGGGTDIANALGYCDRLVTRPRDTVLFVVSDLFEGGDRDMLRRRIAGFVRSGVTVVVLLALADEGTPAHDRTEAATLAALGARVLSCTPQEFPGVLRTVLA